MQNGVETQRKPQTREEEKSKRSLAELRRLVEEVPLRGPPKKMSRTPEELPPSKFSRRNRATSTRSVTWQEALHSEASSAIRKTKQTTKKTPQQQNLDQQDGLLAPQYKDITRNNDFKISKSPLDNSDFLDCKTPTPPPEIREKFAIHPRATNSTYIKAAPQKPYNLSNSSKMMFVFAWMCLLLLIYKNLLQTNNTIAIKDNEPKEPLVPSYTQGKGSNTQNDPASNKKNLVRPTWN